MPERSPAWLDRLEAAKDATQLIVVACVDKSTASVTMHEKDRTGTWTQLLSTPGFIGKNGLGKEREGDMKTPKGVFALDCAFGTAPDPGCVFPYRQLDQEDYWSGDHRPGMRYNQMVHLSDMPELDTNNSEHLVEYGVCYRYCMNMGYNPANIPGLGSALFLHCLSPLRPYTAGCVAIPEDKMRQVLELVKPGCLIVIDRMEALGVTL